MKQRFAVTGVVLSAVATSAMAAPEYQVINLGLFAAMSPAPASTILRMQDINNAGQIVGLANDSSYRSYAFRTQPYQPLNPSTDKLGVFGSSAGADAINSLGQVVGWTDDSDGNRFGFRTTPEGNATQSGNIGYLSTYYDQVSVRAYGINDAGQVVGESMAPGELGNSHAFRTAANAPIDPATDDLGTLGGASSGASDINASGQVTGWAMTAARKWHAYRTTATGKIDASADLGTLGGDESWGLAINSSGRVAGYSRIAGSYDVHAFLTSAAGGIDAASDLGTLAGGNSQANDLNELGLVVGYSSDPTDLYKKIAFIYQDGRGMLNLNDLIEPTSGWLLRNATGINDLGYVVGTGELNGVPHGFLLVPVPEPIGLSAVGVVVAVLARRRRAGGDSRESTTRRVSFGGHR